MRYSPSLNAFYDPNLFAPGTLPADVVEIAPEEHQALLAAQAEGLAIVAGDDGRPTAAGQPAST